MTEVVTTSETVGGYVKPIIGAIAGGKNTIDMDQARIVAAAYGTAGLALGSIIARKRAASGAEPILKVFF